MAGGNNDERGFAVVLRRTRAGDGIIAMRIMPSFGALISLFAASQRGLCRSYGGFLLLLWQKTLYQL